MFLHHAVNLREEVSVLDGVKLFMTNSIVGLVLKFYSGSGDIVAYDGALHESDQVVNMNGATSEFIDKHAEDLVVAHLNDFNSRVEVFGHGGGFIGRFAL